VSKYEKIEEMIKKMANEEYKPNWHGGVDESASARGGFINGCRLMLSALSNEIDFEYVNEEARDWAEGLSHIQEQGATYTFADGARWQFEQMMSPEYQARAYLMSQDDQTVALAREVEEKDKEIKTLKDRCEELRSNAVGRNVKNEMLTAIVSDLRKKLTASESKTEYQKDLEEKNREIKALISHKVSNLETENARLQKVVELAESLATHPAVYSEAELRNESLKVRRDLLMNELYNKTYPSWEDFPISEISYGLGAPFVGIGVFTTDRKFSWPDPESTTDSEFESWVKHLEDNGYKVPDKYLFMRRTSK
jgi:hypothetical protein